MITEETNVLRQLVQIPLILLEKAISDLQSAALYLLDAPRPSMIILRILYELPLKITPTVV